MDTGEHTERMAKLCQTTSVARPPFEITPSFISQSWWGLNVMGMEGRTPNPTEISKLKSSKPPPPFQCLMQAQICGATVPCTCLQVQSTREVLDEFRPGKRQAKIIVNTSCLGTCVGFRPDFKPSKEVQAMWMCPHCGQGRLLVLALLCHSPQAAASGWPWRKAANSKDVLSQFIFLLFYCNSVWCG